ncbi:MAG: CRISPR system precrRNA processing endoribonuclease RAMP protein Cas6 [Deltaproteobacteria bacterium]|nr:CRISPR system precrRNA processing endoribonuclease RAMP protein Cas6 [Deltaproteobacteria bacterium]
MRRSWTVLYGKYRFHSILESDAILPPYKGSTFRGVFGLALKKVVCVLKTQECKDCLLRDRCVYFQVFETPRNPSPGIPADKRPSPPHPFVIEPPLSRHTHLKQGESFDFGLILFGPASEKLPYFVYAFEQMGRIGIGQKIRGQRPQFHLIRVTSDDKVIYQAQDRRLLLDSTTNLQLAAPAPEDKSCNQITVILQTPLRLKFRNTYRAELPFHVLIRGILRRIAALNNHYGAGEPDLDYRGLVARAQEIKTVASSVRWYDWKRYSNRQEQAMLMGGMIGQVTYRGTLGEFLPLVRFAEQVHLGKATTFGLGKIKMVRET